MIKTIATTAGLLALGACSAPAEPTAAPEPRPEPEPAITASPAPEPSTTAEAELVVVPELSDYEGAHIDGVDFNVDVTGTYRTPQPLCDPYGYCSDPPSQGSEYIVFEITVTNVGAYPVYFDWGYSEATDVDGRRYIDSWDAAYAQCDAYCGDDLNPGQSAETVVVFHAPTDTEFASVSVDGGELVP